MVWLLRQENRKVRRKGVRSMFSDKALSEKRGVRAEKWTGPRLCSSPGSYARRLWTAAKNDATNFAMT